MAQQNRNRYQKYLRNRPNKSLWLEGDSKYNYSNAIFSKKWILDKCNVPSDSLIPNTKEGEIYKQISLEVTNFMIKIHKTSENKLDFSLFLMLLEELGFIRSKYSKVKEYSTTWSRMNKNTYKYRKFSSSYCDTSKSSKIFKISESMNRKPQNLKSNGVIKDFKELKLLNEMWSHLRGRRNGYILMKNIKIYIAAIMNLWLPWMKARYVYEFKHDCNSFNSQEIETTENKTSKVFWNWFHHIIKIVVV